MPYINYEYFRGLYGEIGLSEKDFNRLSWDACRKLDVATSGVDNVRKLKIAFPVDDDSSEAVKRCACKMVYTLFQIEQAEKTANQAKGYIETENGLRGNLISSVSAGNESISYVTSSSSSTATMIDKALSDPAAQEKLFNDTAREYLAGVTDANGVNLLYMGRYPCAVSS